MIRFEDVGVEFKRNKAPVVIVTQSLTVTLQKNDFTCILGPSGCGKTTLLNLVAGLHTPNEGRVLVDEVLVVSSKLKLGYVFQGHNIFPWKTVRQNINFGLTSLKVSALDKVKRIEKISKDLGIYDFLDSYPNSLSGGMKQRVGIARALVGDPEIILMDEPFASLDALTALRTRKLLKDICKNRKITIVFVTHNIDEALELGDRILVVSKSPMKILIDKRVAKDDYNNRVSVAVLKDKIYDTLKSNMSE